MECLRITATDGTVTLINQTNIVSMSLSAATTYGGSAAPNGFVKKSNIIGVTYNKIVGASMTYVTVSSIPSWQPGVNLLYEYGEQTYDNAFNAFYTNIPNS